MKISIAKWQITGAIFIFIVGTIWHFLYNWSGQMKLLGLIAPVNESVWEHLKMILFPSLIWAIIEYKYIQNATNNFLVAIVSSIITSMTLIVVIYYTYTFILGSNKLIADILTFAISIMVGQCIGYKILTSQSYPKLVHKAFSFILIIIVVMFIIFTINPPNLPIFK